MTSSPANQTAAKNGTAAPTVMLKGIFEQVAEVQNVSKKQAQDLLVGMVETMTEHLKRGDRIRINGLGTLEVRQREARTGRNPAKVAFRPAKELKEAV
jgi:DNA-binding protein HU-beta